MQIMQKIIENKISYYHTLDILFQKNSVKRTILYKHYTQVLELSKATSILSQIKLLRKCMAAERQFKTSKLKSNIY